jgi:hypothetical protein
MEPTLPARLALAVVVITLVALLSIWLLLDTRAARKARRTWEAAIEARFREHGGHSGRLMLLERVLDAHIATHHFDVRQTVARPRPTDAQLAAAARTGATAADLEAAQLPEPPVDSLGDRGGINPGDPIPGRAEQPGEDEKTQVYEGAHALRSTMLGVGHPPAPHPLAGIEPERPTSSATRTADAFRQRHGSSPTLISAGVTPGRRRSAPGPSTPPGAPAHDIDAEANP